MTIEPYNYNDEPSGRTDTLTQALDKCERLEKQLNLALRGLQEYAKEENWHSIYDTESFDWQPLYYSRKWKEDFGYMYAQDILLKIKDIKK